MPVVDNTGNIQVNGVGVQITVTAADQAASITNSGNIIATLDGVLVEADPSNLTATGTFVVDNSGTIESTGGGHAINFALSVSSPGSITILNQETGVLEVAAGDAILIGGDSAAAITNKGTITGGISTSGGADTFDLYTGSTISGLLDSGLGTDTVNLQGTGQGTLNSFADVEVVNLFSGDWTLGSEDVASVNFQTGQQTLGLAESVLADGTFDGTITNFSLGDVINLEGIGLASSATLAANNVLTIAGGSAGPVTLQLDPGQDFSGRVFQLVSDGTGGTNVLLATTSTIVNNGDIIVGPNADGILITVTPVDPGASSTITNSGTVSAGLDGVRVTADPASLTATGTFVVNNSGTIESTGSGHAINFDLSVSSPGSITIVNQETGHLLAGAGDAGDAIVIASDSADAITNRGTIIGGVSTGGGADTFDLFTGSSISGLVDAGSGSDTVNLQGTGQGTLNSFADVEVVNLFSGDWTLGSEGVVSVNFQNGLQTLGLGATVLADGQFSGTINNFASGDIIDLNGIGLATSATLGANNVLTIAGGSVDPITLQLDPGQDFSGQVFELASDGAGGTNITFAPAATAGGTGDDILGGTSGNDVISSGNGNDIIVSGDGNDQISGGNGNDALQAGNGNSVLSGGNGQDVLIAGNGDNILTGGNHNDMVTAGDGNNTLGGGNGNDTLIVGNGNNNLSGGNGNDTFDIGTGDNVLSGGNGSDTFVFGPDFGENVIADFGGNDQIEFDGVFADFQALQDAIQQVGADAVITLDTDSSITLLDVSVNSLQASDFLLA